MALGLLTWLLIALALHLRSEREIRRQTQHSTSATIEHEHDAIKPLLGQSSTSKSNASANTGNNTRRTAVVVAKVNADNATWLEDYFPQWEKNIYIVDEEKAKLKIPKNKGRESMVYLRCVDLVFGLAKLLHALGG